MQPGRGARQQALQLVQALPHQGQAGHEQALQRLGGVWGGQFVRVTREKGRGWGHERASLPLAPFMIDTNSQNASSSLAQYINTASTRGGSDECEQKVAQRTSTRPPATPRPRN